MLDRRVRSGAIATAPDPYHPDMSDERRSRLPPRLRSRLGALLAATVVLAGVVAPAAAATSTPTARAMASPDGTRLVRQRPCPESEFTCVTLRVPADHFAPPGGPMIDVTFAIHRATSGHRTGVFVTATGGPGSSGIAAADPYTAYFDTRIIEQDDIVFFDQRGVGRSAPLQCPDAAVAFYTSPHVPTVSAGEAIAYAADSARFARACIRESGVDPATLSIYSTRQAVEDLEAFRRWLGASSIDLYGESYGTQYAQQYALAHPDHVHSLMLDGPVDLTLDDHAYYAEDVRAFDTVLSRTLDACTETRACRSDLGRVGDALAGYDQLAARLRRGPIAYDFVRADGTIERRSFGLADLELAAAGYVYDVTDRMLLERAIAWATRGELLPLARLAYLSAGQDPETLAAIPDPTWSDAMYYAVECMDYDFGPGSAATRTAAYLRAGRAADVDDVRLGSIFYGDLPCADWPVGPGPGRPPALTRTPFPVFVLASTWDPATPYAGAVRIAGRLSDAYLIVEPGGPHVIFGRGDACPDDLITAYLVAGTRPASRRVTCDFAGVDAYVRLPAERVGQYRDALAAMRATDDELNIDADYWAWDGTGKLQVGCLLGGSMTYRPYADGYRVHLDGCTFSRGLALTGRATIDTTDGTFRLVVTAPGGTSLVYTRDADGRRSVSGRYRGSPA